MKRPFLTFRIGRNYWRNSGWLVVFILAPFPEEEQVQGELAAALINAEMRISPAWPFVRISAYTPARDEHVARLQEEMRPA